MEAGAWDRNLIHFAAFVVGVLVMLMTRIAFDI